MEWGGEYREECSSFSTTPLTIIELRPGPLPPGFSKVDVDSGEGRVEVPSSLDVNNHNAATVTNLGTLRLSAESASETRRLQSRKRIIARKKNHSSLTTRLMTKRVVTCRLLLSWHATPWTGLQTRVPVNT